ncbi:MAG: LCP family protein, partial [Acidimicrobiales bacterium]
DSVHLLAVNPHSRQGTLVGFPRDSYVDIPGRGRAKINDALARGGPDLLAETVRRLTGLPVHYYVLTAFAGFEALVDDFGGLDVLVEHPMRDANSGAYLDPGWQRLSGAEALAFARNRYGVANGDFTRSENQGRLMLAALGRLRAEVGDDAGLLEWLDRFLRHVQFDVPPADLPRLAALARALDPDRVTNLVLPGRTGRAGAASVVFLSDAIGPLFDDIRGDGVLGDAEILAP